MSRALQGQAGIPGACNDSRHGDQAPCIASKCHSHSSTEMANGGHDISPYAPEEDSSRDELIDEVALESSVLSIPIISIATQGRSSNTLREFR